MRPDDGRSRAARRSTASSRGSSFHKSSAQVVALRSGEFCCPRLPCYYGFLRLPAQHRAPLRLAPYRQPYGVGGADHAGYRRSLTLPSAHAVAQNAGGDHRFISLSIHGRCCLHRHTGDLTTHSPDSPSASRPDSHDGANAFPFGTACDLSLCPGGDLAPLGKCGSLGRNVNPTPLVPGAGKRPARSLSRSRAHRRRPEGPARSRARAA